ncbi:MAG: class I SAM-dependent methyltransferase [Oscillospiraceae bacterium]|nr:class I SAM-dependent methyltransferase [Oscillospiraceae bacterium]
MENVKEYVELVKAPWGKIFYDLVFTQLDIPQTPRLKILDFGSGLGVTANHYAKWHDVTAIEPNEEMIDNSYKQNPYTQIQGGIEKVAPMKELSFDIILCHNVLEYIEDKEPIVAELLRVINSDGVLSIVKHNRAGRVFHTSVFKNDPKKALTLLDENTNDRSNYLGMQYIYANEYMAALAHKYGGIIKDVYGMRTFYALGQDNAVKYTDEWYKSMLILENSVASVDEYRSAAFFNHLLIKKE